MGKDWLDQKLAGSLQSGVVALLSKKASAWTRRWPGMEVVVVVGAVLILFYEWRKMGMNLKISWLGSKVAQGLILHTVLGMVGQGGAWVSTVNALGVYLLLSSFEGQISGSTQYIFAENFAVFLKGFGPASWAVIGLAQQYLVSMPRLRECAGLVGVQLFQTWLQENVIGSLRFYTTILLLYFSENLWPGGLGGEVHSFAVYAVTSDMQVQFAPLWAQFAGFWVASTLAWDETTKQILLLASVHSGASFVTEYFDEVAKTDPYLAILGIGVAVAVFLRVK